ncbi:MAG: DUF2815 family protein, partial [Clostridiaceae bacterium]|nr:DUF2815 family protein [Clostridiaceae bacterium]
PFFYNVGPANKGITLYLNEIIKIKDGEKLGKSAESVELDFDDIGLSEESKNDDDGWNLV